MADRFVAAAEAMRRGGWWEVGALGTDRAIKRRILREMLAHYVGSWRRGGRSVAATNSLLAAALGGAAPAAPASPTSSSSGTAAPWSAEHAPPTSPLAPTQH